jgi:hypothetical protein
MLRPVTRSHSSTLWHFHCCFPYTRYAAGRHCVLPVLLAAVCRFWWFSESFQLTARIVTSRWQQLLRLPSGLWSGLWHHTVSPQHQELSIKQQGSFLSLCCFCLVLQHNSDLYQLNCAAPLVPIHYCAAPLVQSWIPWCPGFVCAPVSKYPERFFFFNFTVLDVLLIVLAGTCSLVDWVCWQ